MRMEAFMLSCPEREAVRRQTLEHLRQTDWAEEATVIVEDSDLPRRQERQERGALRLLQAALAQSGWDYALCLEDDLRFNRHLRHNLESWQPLRAGRVALASLYNPNIRRLRTLPEERCFIADTEAVYGAQAFLLGRDCAAYIVTHYLEVPGMSDIKFSRLAGRLQAIYYHCPSLVQHAPVPSVWGGAYHCAADFDADFRAGDDGAARTITASTVAAARRAPESRIPRAPAAG
jgi:hypothetical protein